MCTCGFRTDLKKPVSEKQSRTTSCSNGFDVHLRSLDTDPGGFGFMNQLIITSITGDIRRGSAHVESNHGHSSFRGHCITDHATCRTGKDGVAALEMSRIGQTSIGLHEQ